MNVSLTPELEKFIEAKVDASEVIREGCSRHFRRTSSCSFRSRRRTLPFGRPCERAGGRHEFGGIDRLRQVHVEAALQRAHPVF